MKEYGNNKARAVDLLQQVRSQLISILNEYIFWFVGMLQQPNEQIPMTDVDLSKMYDTFPVNQQYIQQVSYHDIHQMPVMHPFVQSEHVNSIPLQTIPSMNPMETEEPLPSKKYICTYESLTEASQKTGINTGSIGRCARGKYRQAGGYIWKYTDEVENVA